jgi:hypothetical protein
VITGFNTDVRHEGVTYHVQTEDKGLDSPLLLSLVYVGGAIIASKRTPYEDLIASGFDEQVLTERLQRQHKLICAAIKAGRVADLKRMGGHNGIAAPQAEPDSVKADVTSAEAKGEETKSEDSKIESPKSEATKVEGARGEATKVGGKRRKKSEVEQPVVQSALAEVEGVEAGSVEMGDGEAGGVEAGSGQSAMANQGIVILTTLAEEIDALEAFQTRPVLTLNTAHEVAPPTRDEEPETEAEPILSPPVTEAEVQQTTPDSTDEIYLSLLDDEGDFRAGQLATVKIHVGRGAYGQRAVTDASVTVKVLGTSFRPIILSATTDELGVAVVRALLPRFTSGRAAIIIRAVSGDDAAEMRRIIHQS